MTDTDPLCRLTQISTLKRTLKDKESTLEALETDRSHEAAAASERARESTVKLKDAVRQASKTERELKAIMEQDRANEVEMLRSAVSRLEEEIGRYRSGAVVVGATSSPPTRDASSLEAELERNVNEVEALRRALEDQQEEAAEAKNALEEVRTLYSQAQEELEELQSGRPSDRSSPTNTLGTSSALGGDVDALQLELSSARAQIRSLEDECFHSEQTRVKMLKANGDLKSQIESLQDALDKERARPTSTPTSPLPPTASTSRTPFLPTSNQSTPTRGPPRAEVMLIDEQLRRYLQLPKSTMSLPVLSLPRLLHLLRCKLPSYPPLRPLQQVIALPRAVTYDKRPSVCSSREWRMRWVQVIRDD